MDNVTLGAVALGVSLVAFLLVNVLSIQAWLANRTGKTPLFGDDFVANGDSGLIRLRGPQDAARVARDVSKANKRKTAGNKH